uniref:alanine racemase n=1 Tax=Roseburia sp. TaxID=2049040 RepID=UPI003FF0AB1A
MNRYTRVRAVINLDAILYNMNSMHQNISEDTKIMAVIKADGYGHGAAEVAECIEHLDYLAGYAVATVEEGLILRNHGIKKPILILGYAFPDQYDELIAADMRPTVFTREMAQELSQAAGEMGVDCPIHFAVDTGMSRIGYQVTEEAADEMAQIARLPHIMVEGIFTHFARADEADKTSAEEQLALFEKMISMLEERGIKIPIKHCSNSAGIVELKEANMDMVRAGITLYGLWPSEEVRRDIIDLKPALSLITHVAYVKDLEAGRAISYGGTYVTKRPSRIATIPVGYADGYARGLSNKGAVLIHGKRAPICGRVCMDQFMVDVTDIPEVKMGDEVILIGSAGEET